MKIQMTYREFVDIADRIALHIWNNVVNPRLYAVARGGFTLAHRVAYRLALPVGVFYPKQQLEVHPVQSSGTRVFLEDVIATGRTVHAIETFMAEQRTSYPNANNDYKIYPVVVDADCPKFAAVEYYNSLVSKDWVVFPYEDFYAVSEGDRGLFREGTSNNSKALL